MGTWSRVDQVQFVISNYWQSHSGPGIPIAASR